MNKKEYRELQARDPKSIALSFSGGGFRAAAFSTGCLSYMETVSIGEAKFTDLVSFISSASGGSITNLLYTQNERHGFDFLRFYGLMYHTVLDGTQLVENVFEILKNEKAWLERPFKSRNIINAFSIAYDNMFFNHDSFGIYRKEEIGQKTICVNATEFDNAMLFRFQNAGRLGNRFLHFRNTDQAENVASKIKLADILACSSCFPVGFEPFMFPKDFSHPKLSIDELQASISEDRRFSPAKSEDEKNSLNVCFGLMDGGIDDNQGIDSLFKAEERLVLKDSHGYDLFITCDVSSNYTSGFDFPEENKESFLQKFSILQYCFFSVFLFALSLIGIFLNIYSKLGYVLLGISGFILTLLASMTIAGFRIVRQSKKNNAAVPLLLIRNAGYFMKLKLSSLLQILNSRISSSAHLASVAFLKKIRRISYDRLFEKTTERKFVEQNLKNGNDFCAEVTEVKHWRQFALQNSLYLLSHKNDHQRMADLKKESWFQLTDQVDIGSNKYILNELILPSDEMQAIASRATEMDTTLWFDKTHQKENMRSLIIATGQFTTCHNLLKYALRFSAASKNQWAAVQKNLLFDWLRFKEDPFWLVDLYAEKVEILKSDNQ